MSTNHIPLFVAHLIIRGKIKCETGLHIGGSKEKLEIGGVDSIVVRSPRNDFPYIPGSSIKGKMRHLLEYITGAVGDPIIVATNKDWDDRRAILENLGNVSKAEDIVRLFGIGANERADNAQLKNIGLTRLAVRDAFPDKYTVSMWEDDLGSDANYTEYKAENTIDRLTSAANPRFIERVVEGSRFDFEMTYSLYQMPGEDETQWITKANNDIKLLLMALRLLEGSALGKSGSRGYGKISLHLNDPVWVRKNDYLEGSDKWKESKKKPGATLKDLKKLEELTIEQFQYK